MNPAEIDPFLPDFGTFEEADEYLSFAPYGEAWIDADYGVDSQGNPQFSAIVDAYRQWLAVDVAREQEIRQTFLRVTERLKNSGPTFEAEVVEMVVPAKAHRSDPVDLRPHVEQPEGTDLQTLVHLEPRAYASLLRPNSLPR